MVKRIESRTGEEGGESRTGAGPGDVESLDALGAEATAMEQAGEQQAQSLVAKQEDAQARQQQAEQAAAAKEVAEVLKLLRTMVAPAVEGMGYLKPGQTKGIWTDDVFMAASQPLIAIMERHGVGLSDLMDSFGPYLMLFVATALPAVATVRAVRENKAEKAAAQPAEGGEGGQQQPA